MGRERRVFSRSRSFARILLTPEGAMGYVADMGSQGFRGLFLSNPPLVPGSRLRLLMAFTELGVLPFEIEVVVRWSDFDLGTLEAGFELSSDLPDASQRAFEAIGHYYDVNLPRWVS